MGSQICEAVGAVFLLGFLLLFPAGLSYLLQLYFINEALEAGVPEKEIRRAVMETHLYHQDGTGWDML